MNKQQFLNELEKNLAGLPKEDVKEILEDYRDHFTIGKKNNRKESEIAESLGSPKQIAKEAKEELGNYSYKLALGSGFNNLWKETKRTSKKVWRNIEKEISESKKKTTKEENKKSKKSVGKKMLLLSLNIFVMFWIMLAFYILVFSLFISGVSIILSGIITTIVSIFILINPTDLVLRNIAFSGMFAGIGIFCLGLLWSIGSWKLGKVFSWIVRRYSNTTRRWTRK
jgi:uncharacterized membrane protein